MLNEFNAFCKQENLFTSDSRILLAVSGGIDSVVMLDLFSKTGNACAVVHCNFQLRGSESEKDEDFVRSLASHYQMPFFVTRFETRQYSHEKGLSTQQAARDLRYTWFEQIRQTQQYHYIAVAHHQDDAIETFFINLSRGTGIGGLGGIKIKNNHIIRPLMFTNREDIVLYANKNGLQFREDSSNKETKYTRNKIRRKIIPLFEEINPSFRQTMIGNLKRLQETSVMSAEVIKKYRDEIIAEGAEGLRISIPGLKECEYRESVLYSILNDFGFTSAMISGVIDILDSQPGKIVCSHSHRLVRDREYLIITTLEKEETGRYYIDPVNQEITEPLHLMLRTINSEQLQMIKDPAYAFLDLDKLSQPLILRKWQHGDIFMPFGMKGLKKVSDYLIDKKVSIPEKENIWVLMSGEKIVWLLGHRIDERYKITSDTKFVLEIQLKSK